MSNSSSGFRRVESLVPDNYDRTVQGTVVADPTTANKLAVNVQGQIISVKWQDPVVATIGDTVLVTMAIGITGQTEAIVRGKITASARPERATVATVPGGPLVTVTGTDGATYSAAYLLSYTPTVGDLVKLDWFGTYPTILAKVTAATVPVVSAGPILAIAPPALPGSGRSVFAASDSASLFPGGWDVLAAQTGTRGRVYQGDNGSGQIYGAFFYSGSPAQLAGRTINRVQILLGSRIGVGTSDQQTGVNFYAHTSNDRPAGDVTRVLGPDTHPASAGQGLTYYDLPISFATQVISGGGISIAGGAFMGFCGTYEQPNSGTLIFDWSM